MNDCDKIKKKYNLNIECCYSCHDEEFDEAGITLLELNDNGNIYFVCCNTIGAYNKL